MTTEASAFTYRRAGVYSEVRLDGGGLIPAVPHDTAEYQDRARELGYPSGVEMSAEHDLIHALLAGVFGGASPVLRAVADGREQPGAWLEEDLVKLIAARVNAPELDGLPGGGLIAWVREQLVQFGARKAAT